MHSLRINTSLCVSDDIYELMSKQGLVDGNSVSSEFPFYLVELLSKESVRLSLAKPDIQQAAPAWFTPKVVSEYSQNSDDLVAVSREDMFPTAPTAAQDHDVTPDKPTDVVSSEVTQSKPKLADPNAVSVELSSLFKKKK